MEKKSREIPYENGFLNDLRAKAERLDVKTLEELRNQVETNKSGELQPKRTRLSDRDLSKLTIELK